MQLRLQQLAHWKPFQQLSYFSSKGVWSKWFLQKRHTVVEYTMANDGIVCITRHIKYQYLWTLFHNTLGEFPATHLWHSYVCNHQMNLSNVGLAQATSLFSIGSTQDAIA